ncbi:hypothetical protein PR202_ga24572 [Eleusine coracana subsp. coracana]|uniref:Uncharacterized protein n=1 Tax=Eleusine coracana subsp. coracana TaxID=191504 RepID=A0AAV5D9K2_ELECO|nr:hypothetical protein PR202_ga24572 [Eleusine coracana subsp. coracana]
MSRRVRSSGRDGGLGCRSSCRARISSSRRAHEPGAQAPTAPKARAARALPCSSRPLSLELELPSHRSPGLPELPRVCRVRSSRHIGGPAATMPLRCPAALGGRLVVRD